MEVLKPYRARIDALDDQIIDLLAKRFDIIREVGHVKAEQNIPPVLPDRVEQVRERCVERGVKLNIDGKLVRQLYTLIITHACDMEEDIRKNAA